MGRRRTRDPKRNQLGLRLTDHQLELLRLYAKHRGYLSEVDAIRGLIDGMEDWLARLEAKQAAEHHLQSSEASAPEADSGLPPAIDGALSDVDPSDVASDVEDSDESASVGDFGGRPRIGLPGLEEEED